MECLQRSVFLLGKSTPQFKIELISGDYFFPCGSKFFPGKYCSGSTFFPGNYYSGSNFFREVVIYGYTGTHAVHLEVTTDVNANSLLLALRRFFARKGIPNMIISDNFKGTLMQI